MWIYPHEKASEILLPGRRLYSSSFGIFKLLWKYFTMSFIPFYLNMSVLWDRPCDFSKSWRSSCHLKFCMYKTKLIICTPFDPLFKTGPPGITPSVNGSSMLPVTLDRIFVSSSALSNVSFQWIITKFCHSYLRNIFHAVSCSVKA